MASEDGGVLLSNPQPVFLFLAELKHVLHSLQMWSRDYSCTANLFPALQGCQI